MSRSCTDRRLRFIHSDQLEPQRRGALYLCSGTEEPLGAPAHTRTATPDEVRGSVQQQVGRGDVAMSSTGNKDNQEASRSGSFFVLWFEEPKMI